MAAAARRARHAMSATPGRLRLASLAIVAVLLVALIVMMASLGSRQRATRDAGLTVEPLMVGTQDIYGSLAHADATAADAFLNGGIEPPDLVSQYATDIKHATDQLAGVTGRATATSARTDLQTITEQLPVYTGLVEAARANNRQNFPVGAAYLRQASAVMRTQILPAANRVYQFEGGQLHRRYSSAGAVIDTIGVAIIVLLALVALVGTQLWMAARTNRVFNIPLVVATVLVVAAGVWTLVAFASSHSALAQGKRTGSDAVEILARARSVALQASSDESLAIIARGNGQAFLTDFDAAKGELGAADGSTGLLAQAARLTSGNPQARANLDGALSAYTAFLNAHNDVRTLDSQGKSQQVVQTATNAEYNAFKVLNDGLESALTAMQKQFTARASSARSTLSPLPFAIPILLVVAALLALAGVQQRMNDYR